MIRNLCIAIGLACSLTACASATKRMEQGQELQRQGRPADAAARYIEALKKDPKLDSARAGLVTAGGSAINGWLLEASSPSIGVDAAADQFLAVDDLVRRAFEVGIYLVTPNDYATRRRAAFDKAIANDVVNARQLASGRQFADALRILSHASTAYQPSPMQQRALGNVGADAALAWARDDTLDGHFRAAYGHVDGIAMLPGVTQSQANQAAALQSVALARATRRVAIIPASATINARRALPEDALPALGDALLGNPWVTPPRFVTPILPDQLQRDLARFGLGRRTITTGEAALLGSALGTDYVVVTEIDSVRRDEMNVRVTRHPIRTRNGVDTAYFSEDGTARLYARASYALIDRNGQRSPNYLTVASSATAPFTRVRYAGDYRTLDLRQGERDIFGQAADDRELVGAFVSAMSPRLAEAVYAEVLRQIP